jgi:hypothetical protein
MDRTYINTVRLLLAVMPEVFRGGVFALKGGTAINLFVHDMPRLSVDIDVAYPDWSASREAALEAIANELQAIAQRLERRGLAVKVMSARGLGESKLLARNADALVKVEANLIFRGSILPVQHRAVSHTTAQAFGIELMVPCLALAELYGSKLVAALDRQHPRDLFDVQIMYETHGLTDAMVQCFMLYLAGHNRPMHEVLCPSRKDMGHEFTASFVGMSREPVELVHLEAARERLMAELPRRLSRAQRDFLVSLARAAPDWSLAGWPHARQLPAIQWRLKNLESFRRRRPLEWARQIEALESVLR